MLQQFIDDIWQPVSFFSKCLKPTMTKYSTFGQELLAVCFAVKLLSHMLEGCAFSVFFTNYKLFIYAFNTKANCLSREIRDLDFIPHYTTDIHYIKGASNSTADALSLIELNIIHTTAIIDHQLIKLINKMMKNYYSYKIHNL